jgi:ornithine carbamoyltransferase
MVGMRFRLLGPQAYFMRADTIEEIRLEYPDADIEQTQDPRVALPEADFVYTDVWTSMGQESEMQPRQVAFRPYQLNMPMLNHAPPACKVLHCLPARRGEEITDDVIDSARSVIVEQAGNRMHAQKGLLVWLSLQHGQLSVEELKRDGIKV